MSADSARQPGSTRAAWRACLVVFCVAFALRAFLLTKIPERYIQPHDRYETTAVAMSLYHRGEFADPYAIPTGPTAHPPPFYPAWLALLYRLFGISLATGYLQWVLEIAIDSAMFAMLPWVGLRLGLGWPAGLAGGLAGGVFPRWVSTPESVAAIALGLLLTASCGRWTRRRARASSALLLGVGWGAACYAQPALLTVALGCAAFDAWWTTGRRRWLGGALTVLGLAIAVAPWTWRNWTTFHELYFIRSNFGLELRVGNHDGAHADVDVSDTLHDLRHPRTNLDEARLVRDLGEAEYMRRARTEALRWIRDHPREYARLVAARAVYFWTGPIYQPVEGPLYLALLLLALLGAARRLGSLTVPQRAALLIPLAAFPLVYYVVSWMPRYRIAIEWILVLLAGSAATGTGRRPSTDGPLDRRGNAASRGPSPADLTPESSPPPPAAPSPGRESPPTPPAAPPRHRPR